MKSNIKHFDIRIFISFMLCLWGIYTIIIYDINLIESIWEQVNGLQQLISTINGSNNFLKALVNKYDFIKSDYLNDKMGTIWGFTWASIIMQICISKIYGYFLYYKTNDDSDLMTIISFVTNFFLMFVANHIVLFIFDIAYEHRFFLAKIASPLLNLFGSPSFRSELFSMFLWTIILFLSLIIWALLFIPILLCLLEMLIIAFPFAIIISLKLDIPVFLSIFITISIKAIFKYLVGRKFS